MLTGVPGSGKSTWAKQYASTNENTFIVDTDEVRKSVTGSYQVFPNDRHILYDKMISLANEYFAKTSRNCTVIEDSTFNDNYRRKYYMERIKGYDKAFLFMMKMHDYSICYKRNKMRSEEKWVPEDALTKFINNYEEPTAEVASFFDEIKTFYLD